MTNLIRKILIALLFVFASSATLFGYASITDNFIVNGEASVEFPDYDEVIITNVSVVSNTTNYEDNYFIHPTNLYSTISGSAGQKVVYKVEARNYSTDKTFVYSGTSYNANIYGSINKINVSVSEEVNGSKVLSNDVNLNYSEGKAIAPGENYVFYVSYTLNNSISRGEIMINYKFKRVIYSVSYLNEHELFAVENITNNEVQHNIKMQGPTKQGLNFAGWVNANAVVVNTIPANNTNNYTLSASWDNVYLIIFADAFGNVLYEEQFTSSSTKLSNEGQAIVDQILADLNQEAKKDQMTVAWSDYTIKGAKSDITVKAIYTYSGSLNLVPVYEEPDDGIADYYKIVAVDSLTETVEVPGYIGDVPVRIIERITNVDGDKDWDNFEKNVKTIIINEGVEILEHNSLAWTPNLTTVKLPSTIKTLGKNTFSRNIALGGFGRGDDKKELIIEFNGTKAQWKNILNNSHENWDGGLKRGSQVICKDGYFELASSWKEY